MKFMLIAIFVFSFSLAGCASSCLQGKYPGEIPGKFEKIKRITMEEAVNFGIAHVNENAPYSVKPSKYNGWNGEITYRRYELQPFFSIKFTGNEVCFDDKLFANLTDDRPLKAVAAIKDRVSRLK